MFVSLSNETTKSPIRGRNMGGNKKTPSKKQNQQKAGPPLSSVWNVWNMIPHWEKGDIREKKSRKKKRNLRPMMPYASKRPMVTMLTYKKKGNPSHLLSPPFLVAYR